MGARLDFDKQVLDWVGKLRSGSRAGSQTPDRIVFLEHLLHDMRL